MLPALVSLVWAALTHCRSLTCTAHCAAAACTCLSCPPSLYLSLALAVASPALALSRAVLPLSLPLSLRSLGSPVGAARSRRRRRRRRCGLTLTSVLKRNASAAQHFAHCSFATSSLRRRRRRVAVRATRTYFSCCCCCYFVVAAAAFCAGYAVFFLCFIFCWQFDLVFSCCHLVKHKCASLLLLPLRVFYCCQISQVPQTKCKTYEKWENVLKKRAKKNKIVHLFYSMEHAHFI